MASVLTAHEEGQYVAITSPLGFMVCPSLHLKLTSGPFSRSSSLFAQVCLRAAGGATSSLVRGCGSNNTHLYKNLCRGLSFLSGVPGMNNYDNTRDLQVHLTECHQMWELGQGPESVIPVG